METIAMSSKLSDFKTTPIVVLVGPTACGKSAMAMELAQKYSGEIICADSRTIYKGMNIGTAKPTSGDQRLVPHYCLDLIDPDQAFSASAFKTAALKSIGQIAARKKLPIIGWG